MQILSPDGQYGYVCSSFPPETVAITVKDHQIVGRIPQETPFCPNTAVTPEGGQVWLTLKDVGKTMVFSGRPPFAVLKTIATGPIANHVKIVRNSSGTFAYVTVGGLNQVQVFRTDDFSKVTTIPVGKLPHGVWDSGDGTRVYVGLENDDRLVAIAKGVTLFALVDHSGEAAKVGITMPPTKLLIFGTPKAGTPLMLAAPSVAIDLPLKILVSEDAQGRAWLSYNSPAYLQERHGVPQGLLPNIE